MSSAFFELHSGLRRQGPGSDATTRLLLSMAGSLPQRPKVLDLGCGPGRASLLLARAGADVASLDTHQPFLDELGRAAREAGLSERIRTVNHTMAEPPFADGEFDLVWAESSIYVIGFDAGLRAWRRLLARGGRLVVTECEWTTPEPAPAAREYWSRMYPLRTPAENQAAAEAAGYAVEASYRLPDRDWFDDYYTPLSHRIRAADLRDPAMAEAVAATREEIDMRHRYGADYGYTGYLLRPRETEAPMPKHWTTRPETPDDLETIRRVNLAAFPTAEEADLVDALRADAAWLPGLSWVAEAPGTGVVAHALLTRCTVGDGQALVLGPCAVLPEYQRAGAGGAVIRALIDEARARGERLVVVLGHPEYYPRFGFTRASTQDIRTSFEVPDDALMALPLTGAPTPTGTIRYPAPFGV